MDWLSQKDDFLDRDFERFTFRDEKSLNIRTARIRLGSEASS